VYMCHMREQNLIKFVYTYNRKTKNEDKKFVCDSTVSCFVKSSQTDYRCQCLRFSCSDISPENFSQATYKATNLMSLG
jgi:hypothetical protein